jgi:DNA replication protein DnaC
MDLLSDFEMQRFGNSISAREADDTADYYDCDLLIIDDLGTEMSNQFTVSCLYNIINVRINNARATVISTNLSQNDLRQRYWDRITSRLFGEYRPLLFVGNDVRAQKLKKK